MLQSRNFNKHRFLMVFVRSGFWGHRLDSLHQPRLWLRFSHSTWEDERQCENTTRLTSLGHHAWDDSAHSWSASTDLKAQLKTVWIFGEGIGLLLITWRSGWTWGWNARCENVEQQQLISDVYHAWVVFKVGKTVENITPNIRSFIWRDR